MTATNAVVQSLALAMVIATLLLSNSAHAFSECTAPMLPSDLDLITTVQSSDSHEVHLHGMYRIGVADPYDPKRRSMVHNLTVGYKEDTYFRVSVAPHDAVDMDVLIYEKETDKMVTCSMNGGEGIEHNVFAVLKAHVKYVVIFQYTLAWRAGQSCPQIMLELAAQPSKKVPRFSSEVCEEKQSSPHLGTIRPNSDDKYHFEYRSKDVFAMPLGGTKSSSDDSSDEDKKKKDDDDGWNKRPFKAQSDGDDSEESSSDNPMSKANSDLFTPLAHYPIKIPHIRGRHQQWKLKVDIQSRFLDGGDVAAFITLGDSKSSKAPTPKDCAKGDKTKCIYGTRSLRNHFILQDILWAGENGEDGEYTLWLVLRKPEPQLHKHTCAPYSLHIDLFPLKEEETFITCDIDPLPKTFNAPGMYNSETGFMSFQEAVLVNLTTRIAEVTLKPSKDKSLLRAQLGNHESLDIDLVLLKKKGEGDLHSTDDDDKKSDDGGWDARKFGPLSHDMEIVAASMGMSGPEGIVYELKGNVHYTLRVSVPYPYREYSGQDHDFYEFCDSYQLRVHVFPLTNQDDSCDGTKPNLDGFQEKLNNSKPVGFGMPSMEKYAFVHHINKDHTVNQDVFLTKRIYIPKTMAMEVLVESDHYGGTTHIQLQDESSRQILYGAHRTVGSSLHTVLEQGWYKLMLLSPYVQGTTKKWRDISPDMPTCMRYNLVIKIQEKDACLVPLPLPEHFPAGVHGHRHLYDEFKIPSDGHHYMGFKATKDSILHVDVSASDAPLAIKLVKGGVSHMSEADDLVAKSYDDFKTNRPKLMIKIKADTRYTLGFIFDMQASNADRCKSMQLQMSLSPINEEHERRACGKYNQLPQEADVRADKVPVEADFTAAFSAEESVKAKKIFMELPTAAHFRFTMEYDFTRHSFDVLFCSCKAAKDCRLEDCALGYSYRNGIEIPTQALQPGNYSVFLAPWRHGLGDSNDDDSKKDLTRECTDVQFHIALTPIKSEQKPTMCSNMAQYLPHSFNGVGMIWGNYRDEFHFQQDVLVSEQHLEDTSTFKLEKTSILRAYAPRSGSIPASVAIYSIDDDDDSKGVRASALGPNSALYIELKPGTYQFKVRFYARLGARLDCATVPIEVSVTQKDSISKFTRYPPGSSEDDDNRCKGPKFPTKPLHHGHDTLYRIPGQNFRQVIPFTVGERGARYDFDIRYGFESGGLGVELYGVVIGDSGKEEAVKIPMKFYADRAFRSGLLQQGRYQLSIYDPVNSRVYVQAHHASCVPYSIHARFEDYGNYSSGNGDNTNHGGDSSHGKDPTKAPDTEHLDCPQNHYDILPSSSPKDATKYQFDGSAYRIPFHRAVSMRKMVHGREVHFKMTTEEVPLKVPVNSYVRVWVRSMTKTLIQTSLIEGNKTIEEGQFFGWHTQTMLFKPTSSEDTNVVLKITFYHMSRPVYGTDYRTCEELKALDSFEAYVAVFPKSDVQAQTKCPDGFDEDSSNRLPPTEINLEEKRVSFSKDYTFTAADARSAAPGVFQPTHPPKHPKHKKEEDDDDDDWNGHHFSALQKKTHKSNDVPRTYSLIVTGKRDIKIKVPHGTTGASIRAQMRYNLEVSNMRMSLHASNQTSALVSQSGTPLATLESKYSAESALSVSGLGEGTYTLHIEEANAEPRSIHAAYCVPFHLMLVVDAKKFADGDGAPAPTQKGADKPHITQFWPGSSTGLSVADPLKIKFILSESAKYHVDHKFAKLVVVDAETGEETGEHIPAATEFFDEDDKSLVALWTAHSLKWRYSYQLRIDGSGIHTKDGDDEYSSALPRQAIYTMGHCGCMEGKCAPGGACSCSSNSHFCDACSDGFIRSDEQKELGPEGHSRKYTVCVAAPRTHSPAPPKETPQPPPPPTHKHHTPEPDDGWDNPTPAPKHHTPAPTKRRHTPAPDDGYGDSTPAPKHRRTPAPKDDGYGDDTPVPKGASPDSDNGYDPITQETPVPTKASSKDDTNKDSGSKEGPFHTFRYVVSYGALIGIVLYAVFMLIKYRGKAKRAINTNPFRSSGGSPGSGSGHMPLPTSGGGSRAARSAPGTSAFDDDDEDEMQDENQAIVISS